jgi:thiamine-phosphate pyrophosphorylase
MMSTNFLIALLTLPGSFDGEEKCLCELLEAGVERLHLRKPEMRLRELEALVARLAPRWASRLVLHYQPEMALRYGIPQIHGPVKMGGGTSLRVSTSVHSWQEFTALPDGLEYAFISPLFDSISKQGYLANEGLLSLPAAALPCRPIGLGGVSADTIGEMVQRGWTGAAVLGYIWEERGATVKRFEALKKVIDESAERVSRGGL